MQQLTNTRTYFNLTLVTVGLSLAITVSAIFTTVAFCNAMFPDEHLALAVFNNTNYLFMGMYYISAIFFAIWLYNCYKNLIAAGANMRHTAGMAIGRMFIPFLNLYAPYENMNDVSLNLQFIGRTEGFDQYKSNKWIGAWWLLHIISTITITAVGRTGTVIYYGNGISDATIQLIGLVLRTGAGILLVMILLDTRKRETAAYERYYDGSTTPDVANYNSLITD